MASKHNLLFLLEIRDNKRLIHTYYNFSISPRHFDSFGKIDPVWFFCSVTQSGKISLKSVQFCIWNFTFHPGFCARHPNEDTAVRTTSTKTLKILWGMPRVKTIVHGSRARIRPLSRLCILFSQMVISSSITGPSCIRESRTCAKTFRSVWCFSKIELSMSLTSCSNKTKFLTPSRKDRRVRTAAEIPFRRHFEFFLFSWRPLA